MTPNAQHLGGWIDLVVEAVVRDILAEEDEIAAPPPSLRRDCEDHKQLAQLGAWAAARDARVERAFALTVRNGASEVRKQKSRRAGATHD